MTTESLIRETKSYCPFCLATIKAKILIEQGRVYLEKDCSQHGKFRLLLSNYADGYQVLNDIYFSLMGEEFPQRDFVIYTGEECQYDCAACMCKGQESEIRGVSKDKVRNFVSKRKGIRIDLRGGDPSSRNDLCEIIGIVKRSGNRVALHTCGWNLDDVSYLKRLKNAGLDEVHLIFDGFKDLPLIRSNEIGKTRKKALDNLKGADIPTNIEMLVYRNLNEDQVERTFDYCLQNNFIKGLFLVGYRYFGKKSKSFIKYCLMPEEVADIFIRITEKKVSREEIFNFQKLSFVIFSLFKIRKCFHNRHYLINREADQLIPFSEFCDLNLITKRIDVLKKLRKKSSITCFAYLSVLVSAGFLKKRSFMVLLKMTVSFIGFLIWRGTHFLPSSFMMVNFVSICDRYSIDLNMTRQNCGKGILTSEELASSKGLSCYHHRLVS